MLIALLLVILGFVAGLLGALTGIGGGVLLTPILALPFGIPIRQALGASLVAGALSGLLGIGGGPIKVPVMFIFMNVPLMVATATSNFMIGVTAAASAIVYYRRGDIQPQIAAPLAVGVFLGSLLGARLAPRIHARHV